MGHGGRYIGKNNAPPRCRNCGEECTDIEGTTKLRGFCSTECKISRSKKSGREKNGLPKRIKRTSEQLKASKLEVIDMLSIIEQRKTKKKIKTKGCYVYGWYAAGSDLPFYIGKGTGNRAWEKHILQSKGRLSIYEKALCEKIRNKDTQIVIYRDNLTSEGALLIEDVLSTVFKSIGALLYQPWTMKRREIPPLEY